MGAPEVRAQRRAASDSLIEQLAASEDPVLAYKSSLLTGLDPDSAKARSMRARIPSSPMARALLRVFEQDARTLHHTYRKWQGPHWTMTGLAMIDYPAGDERLRPLVRRVHDWLFSKHSRPRLRAGSRGGPAGG